MARKDAAALVAAGHRGQRVSIQLVQFPVNVVEIGGDALASRVPETQVEGAEEANGRQVDAEPGAGKKFFELLCPQVVLGVVEVNGGEGALATIGADGVGGIRREGGGRACVDDRMRLQDVREGHDVEPGVDGGMSEPGGVLCTADEGSGPRQMLELQVSVGEQIVIPQVVFIRFIGHFALVSAFAPDATHFPRERFLRYESCKYPVGQGAYSARRLLGDRGVEQVDLGENEDGGGVDAGGAGVVVRLGRARGSKAHQLFDAVCRLHVHFQSLSLGAPAGGDASVLSTGYDRRQHNTLNPKLEPEGQRRPGTRSGLSLS